MLNNSDIIRVEYSTVSLLMLRSALSQVLLIIYVLLSGASASLYLVITMSEYDFSVNCEYYMEFIVQARWN
jgi:hypothetical protein